jgi:hypothetical protein
MRERAMRREENLHERDERRLARGRAVVVAKKQLREGAALREAMRTAYAEFKRQAQLADDSGHFVLQDMGSVGNIDPELILLAQNAQLVFIHSLTHSLFFFFSKCALPLLLLLLFSCRLLFTIFSPPLSS